MAESETTRTDDETYLEPTDVALIGVPVVTAEFARQLERELHLKDQKIAKLIQERDEAVKQMEAGWLMVADSGIEYYKGVADSLQSQLDRYTRLSEIGESLGGELEEREKRIELQSQLAAAQEAIKGISLKQIEEFRREYWIPPSTHGEPLEEWAEKENSMLAAMCKLATLVAQGDPS